MSKWKIPIIKENGQLCLDTYYQQEATKQGFTVEFIDNHEFDDELIYIRYYSSRSSVSVRFLSKSFGSMVQCSMVFLDQILKNEDPINCAIIKHKPFVVAGRFTFAKRGQDIHIIHTYK